MIAIATAERHDQVSGVACPEDQRADSERQQRRAETAHAAVIASRTEPPPAHGSNL